MVTAIIITIAGVFAAGVAAGIVVVVSFGIRREERHWARMRRLWEERFIQTGEVPEGYLPETAPDSLTGGARRLTGLFVRRETPTSPEAAADYDLLV